MSTITITVVHTLDPTVLNLLGGLLAKVPSASSSKQPAAPVPGPALAAQSKDNAAPAAKTQKPDPEPQPNAPTDSSNVTFDQVHSALLTLKTKKKAAAVRDVLQAFDCKTVQDIPEEKYTEVLEMVNSKLEG